MLSSTQIPIIAIYGIFEVTWCSSDHVTSSIFHIWAWCEAEWTEPVEYSIYNKGMSKLEIHVTLLPTFIVSWASCTNYPFLRQLTQSPTWTHLVALLLCTTSQSQLCLSTAPHHQIALEIVITPFHCSFFVTVNHGACTIKPNKIWHTQSLLYISNPPLRPT